MSSILPYLLNTVLGGGGGFLGNMLKKNGLGLIGNLLSGAVGGNILPMILTALGVLGSHPAAADAANTAASSSPDIASLITALLGGGAGSLLGGLLKPAEKA
jgi:hypothetical protein